MTKVQKSQYVEKNRKGRKTSEQVSRAKNGMVTLKRIGDSS